MEDSGIDSEDKQSTIFDHIQMVPQHTTKKFEMTAAKHMDDLEVAFRGQQTGSGGGTINAYNETTPRSTVKQHARLVEAVDSDDDSAGVVKRQPQSAPQAPNTCRILQRKLELKVERAKRNYSQYQEEHAKKSSQSANLIPINRLSIPGDLEQKPLVDYKSDSSDEPEEISFFPAKLKAKIRKQTKPELSDTFSIQEMTIDSDLDSDDSGTSQNLELLPPMIKSNLLEKLKCVNCFNCASYGS